MLRYCGPWLEIDHTWINVHSIVAVGTYGQDKESSWVDLAGPGSGEPYAVVKGVKALDLIYWIQHIRATYGPNHPLGNIPVMTIEGPRSSMPRHERTTP